MDTMCGTYPVLPPTASCPSAKVQILWSLGPAEDERSSFGPSFSYAGVAKL